MSDLIFNLTGRGGFKIFQRRDFRSALARGCVITATGAPPVKVQVASSDADAIAQFVFDLRADSRIQMASASENAFQAMVQAWWPAASDDRNRSVFVRGQADAEPWFSGVPWELASIAAESGIMSRLAGQNFGRRLAGSVSYRPSLDGRLRILSCVSLDVAHGSSIDPKLFLEEATRVFRDREPGIAWRDISEPNFRPNFQRFLAEIAARSPHVIVLVCHGSVEKGTPSLLFEQWQPLRTVAEALRAAGSAATVVLLACDQALLADASGQISGATVLLRAGVPSVLAMQSKIRADCAAWFLGGFLTGLLFDGRPAAAAALGRRAIAGNFVGGLSSMLDWGYPALFVTDDADEALQPLHERPDAVRRSLLTSMLRIPVPQFDFQRATDEVRAVFFDAEAVIWVTGAPGVGKSHWLRKQCRRHLAAALDSDAFAGRHLLYVDLSRSEGFESVNDFYAEVRRQARESIAPGTGWTPWAWPALASDQPASHLVEIIDTNQLVLVLDNCREGCLPQGFPGFFSGLARSVVVVCADTAEGAGAEFPVPSFSREEFGAYWRAAAGESAREESVWIASGGVPRIAEQLLHAEGEAHTVEPRFMEWVLRDLSPNQRTLFFLMVILQDGVCLSLLRSILFTPEDVRALERKGVFLRDQRRAWPEPFVRLSGSLIDAAWNYHEAEAGSAPAALVQRFESALDRMEGAMDERIVTLLRSPGGDDFILAVQRAYGAQGDLDAMTNLATVVQAEQGTRANWILTNKLWSNVARFADEHPLTGNQWLDFGFSEIYTGNAAGAEICLAQARASAVQPSNPRSLALFEAIVLKDLGRREQEDRIVSLYQDVIVAGENPAAGQDGLKDAALARYNRALIYRHWQRNLPAALQDLDAALAYFLGASDNHMAAITRCEQVEIRLGPDMPAVDFSSCLQDLVNAQEGLRQAQDRAGEVFCSYQIARLYREQALRANDDSRNRLFQRARQAYSETAALAGQYDIILERGAAEIHQVEIAWEFQGDVPNADLIRLLDRALEKLALVRGHAWAHRLRRNGWRLRALGYGNDHAAAVAALTEALKLATTAPCNPQSGGDSMQARIIMVQLARRLIAMGIAGDLDRLYYANEQLIHHFAPEFTFDGTNHEAWMRLLQP